MRLTREDESAIAFDSLLTFTVKAEMSANKEQLLAFIESAIKEGIVQEEPETLEFFLAAKKFVSQQ